MNSSIEHNGKPSIQFEGKIGGIVDYPMRITHDETSKDVTFQKFVRPPGTRIIAINDKDEIYLQQEARAETSKGHDWRLPGGKVIDTFEEYKQYLEQPIPEPIIIKAGKREFLEEAKLHAETFTIFHCSTSGASVTWDLYYLLATDISEADHKHDELEAIITGKWFSKNEVKTMCLTGDIQEDRTVAVLLRFIENEN